MKNIWFRLWMTEECYIVKDYQPILKEKYFRLISNFNDVFLLQNFSPFPLWRKNKSSIYSLVKECHLSNWIAHLSIKIISSDLFWPTLYEGQPPFRPFCSGPFMPFRGPIYGPWVNFILFFLPSSFGHNYPNSDSH